MKTELKAPNTAQKEALGQAFTYAIEKALNEMGDNILGLDWFSSHAEYYNAQSKRRAA